jgi:SAM-dependent methyltransferase
MIRKTKLGEKGTRMPDTRPPRWEEAIHRYLGEVEQLSTESARSHRFTALVQEILGVEPHLIEDFCSGIEMFVKAKGKDRVLSGRVDNLFGNVVIEFESNIPKKRAEAEEQLRRYVAILWSQEPPGTRRPYLCMATDGVRFRTYTPITDDPSALTLEWNNARLSPLEDTDWTKCKADEIFYWLDRYFLRKEILRPTSEAIVRDFGAHSHAFQTTTNSLLATWQEIKSQTGFAVVYNSWEKYLRIVYGSQVAGDELFVCHTYLATLAKLMAWIRISHPERLPEEDEIVGMFEGRLFKEQGIHNFIEEDFFSWVARPQAVRSAVSVVRGLFSLMRNYNLRELSEDVLKSLYQELVDPATRHDLGEYYTPDWLAHRIVRKLLDEKPEGALLDPACGSGTFLYLAIREKRERLGDSLSTLRHILDSVYGADVHPLAVIIAKTNYVLALGDLLKKRKRAITIPVCLADTIRLPVYKPGKFYDLPAYSFDLNGRQVHIPEMLIKDPGLYDRCIELAKEFAQRRSGKKIALEGFQDFLAVQRFRGRENDALVNALFDTAVNLKDFIDSEHDTIWAYILKNNYKPLFFKRKFDFILGNPPWIAFRFMEPAYQQFLKKQIREKYELVKGRGELITHLEVATLFLVRTADLYLKRGGMIAFVLPRSLFSADQHHGLRLRTFIFNDDPGCNLFWREIWDCEEVEPLFKVPTCVVVAEKRGIGEIKYPIAGQVLRGRLGCKNASFQEAIGTLRADHVQFSLSIRGKRSFWETTKQATASAGSFYRTRFAQGATIVPRSFWFVRVRPSPVVGIDPNNPPLETDPRAIERAKEPYRSVKFEGNVGSDFLYATLLSADLLPFGHLGYRLVVLPIMPQGPQYEIIDADEAEKRGFFEMAQWLEKAEREWTERRGAKAERITALGWLDYRRKLTSQNPLARHVVIYNTSGTFLTAAVVTKAPIEFEVNGQQVVAKGFIADTMTYVCQVGTGKKAFFLVAVLNAPVIDKLIKPMQSRGLWGPRHIHKKVLDLPIPGFDSTNAAHQRLAELGEECTSKVEQWLGGGGVGGIKSIGKLRSMVRQMLEDELKDIDVLVKQILG